MGADVIILAVLINVSFLIGVLERYMWRKERKALIHAILSNDTTTHKKPPAKGAAMSEQNDVVVPIGL